jgi:hypothetical protein
MAKLNRIKVAMGLVCALAWSHAVLAAPPTSKTKVPPSPAATAAAAILAEYQTVMKDKNGEGLRTKCDYLQEHKTDGLTVDLILAELEVKQSTDPRADAYVKWQLLSGVDRQFPAASRARALKAYRNAPPPPDHPGIGHEMLNKALTRMGANNPDLETKINEEMIGAKEKYMASIVPFVAYRDEFYTRFSPSLDFFQAVFFDIYSRVSHGTSADALWKKVNPTIRQWALKNDPSPAEMKQLSGDLAQLKKLVSDGKYKPYYRVMWLKEYDKAGLKWQGEGVIGDLDVMDTIGDWLVERAKSSAAIKGTASPAPGTDEKMKK